MESNLAGLAGINCMNDKSNIAFHLNLRESYMRTQQ